jgi:serine/threonine-protein kinase
MRFVEGTDLKTVIERDGPMPIDRAAAIVSHVASALDAAHARGLIHRDVKPANVLIRRDPDGSEHAYLTDFGLTKRPEETTGLTKTGQFMGSVDYAAPEQFEGTALDARTDVYSLACVAYECLTGLVPFPRDRETAVMYAHLKAPPPRVSATRDGIPGPVDEVVAKGMAKRPEDRYRSAGAFASALQRTLAPERPGRQSEVPVRRPRWLVPAGAGVLVAVVAIALLIGRGGGSIPKAAPSSRGAAAPSFTGVVELSSDGQRVGRGIPIRFVQSLATLDKGIAVGDGFVWVFDGDLNAVHKISPVNGTLIGTISVLHPLGLAFANDVVWTAQGGLAGGYDAMFRIDPATNSVSAPIRVGPTCCGGLAFAGHSVWMLSGSSLTRLDASTGRTLDTIDIGGDHLAVGSGKLWVLNNLRGTLTPVDPATDRPGTAISLSGDPRAVAIGFGAAWVVDAAGTVARIPLDGQGGIDTIEVGRQPTDIALGDGDVWVANAASGTVSMIAAVGGTATSFRVGGVPTHLAVGEGGVWVLVEPSIPASTIPG